MRRARYPDLTYERKDGASPEVQGLRIHASIEVGTSSIPGQGRPHMMHALVGGVVGKRFDSRPKKTKKRKATYSLLKREDKRSKAKNKSVWMRNNITGWSMN